MRAARAGRAALLSLALGLVLGTGCAHPHIPGTDIDDTKDNHAILDVMEKYRSALEARDAGGVIALLSADFRDGGGTTSPDDDLDLNIMRQKLPERLARLQDVKVNLDIRRIKIDGNTANAVFYFNANYKLPRYTSKVQMDSDLKQMWFKRVDGTWKIVTGV